MESDDTFIHIRRFGRTSDRILLLDMIELARLEGRLDEQDIFDETDPIMQFRLSGPDGYPGCDDEQRKIIEAFRTRYKEYGTDLESSFNSANQYTKLTLWLANLALKSTQLRALGRSSPRDHRQLLNWMANKRPLQQGIHDFMFPVDDCVSLRQTAGKDVWIEDSIESMLDKKPWSFFRVR